MSLISGIDEEKVLDYVNHDTDLSFLPVEKSLDFTDLILFLSVGMKETITNLYKDFEKWILEYDRKRIDEIFKHN